MPLRNVLLVALALALALCGRVAAAAGSAGKVTLANNLLPLTGNTITATLPLHLEFLSDGVGAWPDLSGSQLRYPPPFLRLLPTTLSNWDLAAGTEVTFSCPNEPTLIDVCDAWVFFYACRQSCVGTYQGGLPGLLSVTPGWERTQCAPSFTTAAAGPPPHFVHPMGSFRKQLAPGTSTTITLPANAEFVAFGIDSDGVDCTQHLTLGACPVADGRCKWEGGACLNQNCRTGLFGPPPPCAECPWQGLVSRPASDGPFGGGPI